MFLSVYSKVRDLLQSEQIDSKRISTTNSKIGPVADQNYEMWNCTILLYRYLEESPICVYIPNIHC